MSDSDTSDRDKDLKWLIEHYHSAYLAFIALWLACMLGTADILINIASKPDKLVPLSPHGILVFLLYWGLVAGMLFAVYRISNIIKQQTIWIIQIRREFLRKEILNDRGTLSKIVVDNEGNIRRAGEFLAFVVHVVFALTFLWLALS